MKSKRVPKMPSALYLQEASNEMTHHTATPQFTTRGESSPMTEITLHAERLTRRPEEVGALLGIGRNGVYELIRKGELRSIRVGRKIIIPLAAIDEFLNRPT